MDAGKQLIDAQWFMEEKISLAYARREYGVAIDERTWKVVPEETARLRAAARSNRISRIPRLDLSGSRLTSNANHLATGAGVLALLLPAETCRIFRRPISSGIDRHPDAAVCVFTTLPLPLFLTQARTANTGWSDPDGGVAIVSGDVQLVLGNLADTLVVRVPVLSVHPPGDEYDACAECYRNDEAHV